MKSYYSFFLFLILSTLLPSCKNEMSNDLGVGLGIQPEGDAITVKTDTFRLQSENLFVDRIYNRPDSLLLGFYDAQKYGQLKADILTEFDAPYGENVVKEKRVPKGATADSIFIVLSYHSFFGEKNSTMQVNVFEFNQGKGLDYNKYYPSDLNPEEFVKTNEANSLIGEKVFTAQKEGSKSRSGQLRIKLDQNFCDKIFKLSQEYNKREEFLDKLKGLYITTNLADATMLNISGINMILYYSYKNGDETVKNNIIYPSNDLISKINRFERPNRELIKTKLSENKEFNYLSTPGNIYTTVKLPLRKMIEKMTAEIGGKKLIINNAKLDINFTLNDSTQINIPLFNNLLLVDKKNKNDFAVNSKLNELYYGTRTRGKGGSGLYSINITNLLTEQAIKAREGKEIEEIQEMLIIPTLFLFINDQRTGKSIHTGIAQMSQITGISICSGENKDKPMKIDVVYSGF